MTRQEAITKFREFYSRFDGRLLYTRNIFVQETLDGFFISSMCNDCDYGQFYAKK